MDGDGADVELGDLHVRDQSDILTFRFAPRRASCPHAALTSSPRRRRMKHEYPASQRTRWKARTPVRSGGPSALPSMGFIGMRFTLTGMPREQARDETRVGGRVVLPDDERVLDRDPSPARQRVRAQRGEELGDRVTTVDRHQAGARLVRRCVERDGQADLAPEVLAEPRDLRHETARGDGDAARGEPDPFAVGEEPEGARGRVVVVQRLAHAHEHDAPERLVLVQKPSSDEDLRHDLVGSACCASAPRRRSRRRRTPSRSRPASRCTG